MAFATASRARSIPEFRIARSAGPADNIPRNAASRVGKLHGHETSITSSGVRPASDARALNFALSDRAKGPGAPGGGGGISEPSALR